MSKVAVGFEIGIEIEDVPFLAEAGSPGTSTASDASVIGGLHIDKSTGALSAKLTPGTGANKWFDMATQAFVTSLVQGSPWKDPVVVDDNTLRASVAAAETAANGADTINSIGIAAGNRILLPLLTSGTVGIYLVSGSSGAWTFTLAETPVDGDSVVIQQGPDAEVIVTYDGAAWLYGGSSVAAIQTELANIRNYVGKSGPGVESPTYTANNNFSAGADLEAAIDGVDVAVGASVVTDAIITAADSVKLNLEALSAAIISATVAGSATGITTPTIIASFLVDEFQSVEYEIVAQQATTQNTARVTLTIFHNGNSSNDATAIREQLSQSQGIGAGIPGIDMTATLTGAGAAQVVNLLAQATPAINVSFRQVDTVLAIA